MIQNNSNFPLGIVQSKGWTADIFIETGIGDGNTFDFIASGDLFEEIHTMDVGGTCVEDVKRRHENDDRLFIHNGSSPDLLREILATRTDKKIMFWLDAHYTPADRPKEQLLDSKYGECPLLEELRSIKEAGLTQQPYIIIDDARFYTGDFWRTPDAMHFKEDQWPKLHHIQEAIPDYEIEEIGGAIFCQPKAQE